MADFRLLLDELIDSLKENKASPRHVAEVLSDALYATDKIANPDYSQRLKAAELILKVNKLIGAQDDTTGEKHQTLIYVTNYRIESINNSKQILPASSAVSNSRIEEKI